MELFDRKSPAYTKVVTGVSQQTGISFHNGDIIEEVIVVASDIALPAVPQNVSLVIDGEGESDTVSYITVSAYKLGLWSHLSTEVLVDVLADTTSAVISWNAVVDASKYRVYVGSGSGSYTHYIETDALTLEFIDATQSVGAPSDHAVSDKDVTVKTVSNGSVLATLTLTANNLPVKSNISFIAGADTSTLFFTPEFGKIDIIINYKPSQRLWDFASFVNDSNIPSVDIHINRNRTDSYVADGTINKPFKTISAALSTTPTVPVSIHLSPGNYVEPDALSFPAVQIVIYGNGSTLTIPSVTINAPYTIYNLNTIGDVIYAYTGTTRSLRIGGSLVGDVSVSGFEDYESVNFSAHTVTVQANSNPLFSHCTFGSKLVSGASTATITVNDCQFSRPTVDDYNIDMASGGVLICKGILAENKSYATGGTHANINLAGASTTTPSLLSGCICGNGIAAGTAYVIMGSDNISPLLTGSKIVFITGITSSIATFGLGGGTAQAQTATIPILIGTYVPGMRFTYISSVSNTGAEPTLNVNAFGTKTMIRGVGCSVSSALVANDILIGTPVECLYDGTYVRVMNPQVK